MNDIDTSNLVFSVPVRVLRTDAQCNAELMALALEKHVYDPAILDERTPFFWSLEASNTLIDSYYTRMTLGTLGNFQADAKAGVAFLPGHRHSDLPFGRSLDAQIETAQNPDRTRLTVDFYTMPGLTLNSVKTDDLIDGIRSGILKDVSIGFTSTEMTCDICGRDMWDWDCPHVPGMKYEIKGQDNVMRVVQATFAVDDAHLSEVSSVYDGATPRAEILKAEREAAEGRMKPDAVRMFETRYRMKLPEAKRTYTGVTLEGKKLEAEQIVNQVREVLAIDDKTDLAGAIIQLKTELESNRSAQAALVAAQDKVVELTPLADDGRAYRSDLITEALAQGIRAFGEKFAKETYEDVLKRASLAVIKQLSSDWQAIGDSRFTGGRQSEDKGDKPEAEAKQPTGARIPSNAYKA